MSAVKQIIIMMIITIATVESHAALRISRNLVRSIEASVNNKCSIEALRKTNCKEVYNCINDKNNNTCHTLDNYANFMAIKKDCIDTHSESNGYGVLIVICVWLFTLFLISGGGEYH